MRTTEATISLCMFMTAYLSSQGDLCGTAALIATFRNSSGLGRAFVVSCCQASVLGLRRIRFAGCNRQQLRVGHVIYRPVCNIGVDGLRWPAARQACGSATTDGVGGMRCVSVYFSELRRFHRQ